MRQALLLTEAERRREKDGRGRQRALPRDLVTRVQKAIVKAQTERHVTAAWVQRTSLGGSSGCGHGSLSADIGAQVSIQCVRVVHAFVHSFVLSWIQTCPGRLLRTLQ